ncbi:MAG: hypothetical protein MJE63_02095, partial [Proteobacteria bacterium]|nr:hypothetical protein [Pseudomonadota bacterium]
MGDYLYTRNATPNVTITGLEPFADYTLYVYSAGNASDQNAIWNFYGQEVTTVPPDAATTELTEGEDYIVFELSADANGEITGTWKNDGSKFTGFNALQIVSGGGGKASSPNPESSDITVDSQVVSAISWTAFDPADDPNLVSVDSFDVWFYSATDAEIEADPNKADPEKFAEFAQLIEDDTTLTSKAVTLDYSTNYFWRVDSNLTWNYPGFEPVAVGNLWTFKTKDLYIPPTVTMDNVLTTLDIGQAVLTAVVDGSNPLETIEFSLLTDDENFPAGTNPAISSTDLTGTFTFDSVASVDDPAV